MADDKKKSQVNPEVDKVIKIPKSWYQQPHRKKMRFFIPEWDDRVEPDYIFDGDRKPHGQSAWNNTVYAHQLYDTPNYDGILVSKVIAEKGEHKRQMVNELGIHRFLRVPREFPVFGDCGAFDYITKDAPPFTTDEMLNYYSRLDFDYGVSLDHLILDSHDKPTRDFRYKLTINNAKDFIKGHKKLKCGWVAVGAVQGWDPESYAEAAKKIVEMGYRYIALGGLVRSKTNTIVEILKAVRELIPDDIDIHMFGVARLDAIPLFVKYGVTSVDSASQLRTAWLGSKKNYSTKERWYSAIRIPQTDNSFRITQLIDEGAISLDEVKRLEKNCLSGLRQYAKSTAPPSKTVIENLVSYDTLVSPTRKHSVGRIKEVLIDMDSHSSVDADNWYIEWIKPQTEKRFQRIKEKTISNGDISASKLASQESICFKGIKQYLKNKQEGDEPSNQLINRIFEYEYTVHGYRGNAKNRIYDTLINRPWEDETCRISQDAGVEAIIFRGNNRNRRRGFHNVYVFYEMFKLYVNDYESQLEIKETELKIKKLNKKNKKLNKKIIDQSKKLNKKIIDPSLNITWEVLRRRGDYINQRNTVFGALCKRLQYHEYFDGEVNDDDFFYNWEEAMESIALDPELTTMVDDDGLTLLFHACCVNGVCSSAGGWEYQEVKEFIIALLDVNSSTINNHNNPLHEACHYIRNFDYEDDQGIGHDSIFEDGVDEIIKILIERGADPNLADDDGITALHIAAAHSDYDLVNFLLKNGANKEIEIKNSRMILTSNHTGVHAESGMKPEDISKESLTEELWDEDPFKKLYNQYD